MKKHDSEPFKQGVAGSNPVRPVLKLKMENALKHKFVPKHTLMTEEEVNNLLKEYNISKYQLPKIVAKDPIVKIMGAKAGDVVKIERKSQTAKRTFNYRCVI